MFTGWKNETKTSTLFEKLFPITTSEFPKISETVFPQKWKLYGSSNWVSVNFSMFCVLWKHYNKEMKMIQNIVIFPRHPTGWLFFHKQTIATMVLQIEIMKSWSEKTTFWITPTFSKRQALRSCKSRAGLQMIRWSKFLRQIRPLHYPPHVVLQALLD